MVPFFLRARKKKGTITWAHLFRARRKKGTITWAQSITLHGSMSFARGVRVGATRERCRQSCDLTLFALRETKPTHFDLGGNWGGGGGGGGPMAKNGDGEFGFFICQIRHFPPIFDFGISDLTDF